MKIKIGKGKKAIQVEVFDRNCPKRNCFYYGYYTHQSAAGKSGCSSWADDFLSCLRREKHGCPDFDIGTDRYIKPITKKER